MGQGRGPLFFVRQSFSLGVLVKWWQRGTAGAVVAVIVTAAMALGAAAPANAAACLSSVTCQPANTLMLAKAGIIAVPAVTGGSVGVVAARSGVAGAAAGGLMEVLNGIGAGFTITQVFDAIGGMFTGSAGLSTDGIHDQTLTVNADADATALGLKSDTNYSYSTGGRSCDTSGTHCATLGTYAPSPYAPFNMMYCISTTDSYFSGQSGLVQYGAGTAYTSGSIYWNSSPFWCPPVAGAVLYSSFDTQKPSAYTVQATSWKAGSSGSFATGATIPAPPVAPVLTPGRLDKRVWCRGADGVLTDYITAQIVSLKVGQSVNLADAKCPVNKVAVDVGIDWTPDGGTKRTVLPPKGTDPSTYSPQKTKALQFPQCAGGGCILELRRINGDPCGPTGLLCRDWASDPNYASKYQCFYGGTLVDLTYCSAYRAPLSGVQPNINDDGTQVPVTAPPLAEPGTPVKPGTATPVPDQQKESDPHGCAPSSVIEMLNPFALFGALMCVIKDSFVPDPVKIQTSVQGVQDSWSDTPFVKVSGMVSSVAEAVPVNQQGCSGIGFTFPAVLGVPAQNFSILNACTEPLAGIATIVRTVGSIGVIFAGILALTKMAGGVINLPGMGGKSAD